MRGRRFLIAANACALIALPWPHKVLAQTDSSASATEEIKYRGISFRLPRLGWKRSEGAWLILTRPVAPNRFHTMTVAATQVPPGAQFHTPGQHTAAYFQFQKDAPRPAEDKWQWLSELVQSASSRQFAATRFTIIRSANPSSPLVHGISVLYFPLDFAQRQVFYCFMWIDQHLPNVVPPEADMAPLLVALSSVSPEPTPLVETTLARLNDLRLAGVKPLDLKKGKTEAESAVRTTESMSTYSSAVAATFDELAISWRVDVGKPDKYHVVQTAAVGSDEWITIGRDSYRSIIDQWMKKDLGEVEMNNNFRVENVMLIMSMNDPIAASESVSPESSYTVLDYRVVPKRVFGMQTTGMTTPGEVRVWIDKRTNLIARSDMTIDGLMEGKKTHLVWKQAFAGYGIPIRIEPP